MNTDDIVNQFANILENRNVKPFILYGDKQSDPSIYKEVKVRDVMSIISKQLKAIKNADSVGRDVQRNKTSCLNKKSDIVPVILTPVEEQSNTENKFETQCILDTQLINLIENVEATIDVQNNIKKIDTALCQETNSNNLEENDVIKKYNNNADNITRKEGKAQTCKNNAPSQENQQNNIINTHDNKNNTHEALGHDYSSIINDCITDNDVFNDLDCTINELEAPTSPILKINKHIPKHQHLIFTLEEFDKFESLAAPVLNGGTDYEDAKRIINSQLKATDLFVKTHTEIVTIDKDIECEEYLNQFNNNMPKTQYSFDVNSGLIGNVIEDEMLFDSDDNECSEELPLTCALEHSFSNDIKVVDKTMYVGFQTASNRSIQVLSDSFKKAKTVFDNLSKTVAENVLKTPHEDNDFIKDNDETDKEMEKKNKPYPSDFYNTEENVIEFKNMKNDNNHITEYIDEYIMKEFENNLMPCESNESTENTNQRQIHCTHGIGIHNNFKSNKETNISLNTELDNDNLKRSNPDFMGVKTASNKKIKISDDALSKSRKIFDDIDFNNSENKINTDLAQVSEESNNYFIGFKTASNKTVKISAEAVLKTKNIFDNIDNEILSNCPEDNQKSIKPNRMKTEPVITGFIYSMSLKNVKRSTSLQLKDTDLDASSNYKNNSNKHKVANRFQGFKTASNKTVLISKNALEKSKKLFQDIEKYDVENKEEIEGMENKYPVKKETCLSFKGFKTANNKPIKISDDALLNTKKVFQDIENENKLSNDGYTVQSSIPQGFNTADNKPVSVLQDNYRKSNNFFLDIKDEHNNKNVASNQKNTVFKSPDLKSICVTKETTIDKFKTCFAGFQTASNKKVKISEEALKKSRKIFEDIDIDNENKDKTDVTVKGFCTASNKTVSISNEALIKSGKLFENLRDKNEYCEEELKKNIKAKLKNNTSNNTNIIKKPDNYKIQEIINKENKISESGINVEDFINTEIIKIFDESLHTEDFFKDITPRCKRSGSPILSCAKIKKKKFEPPKTANKNMQHDIKIPKLLNFFQFDDNYKKIKKYKLTDILTEKSDLIENIDPYIIKFNFDTLLDFRFENNRNDIDSVSWTTDKIKTYFTDCVSKKIIPKGWIDNHMKLIIWKLISYEIFSPKRMKYACSIKNVLQQLKYRYDKELYNVERPALRKILEKDEVSIKSMVLCVASLYVDGVSVSSVTNQTKNMELLLTDGWYCVKASADRMIDKLIVDGKISIGTKLAIHGAELINCEQGISPWEDTSAVRLKISGNSTKRAKWDARLGFHGHGAILSPLTAVSPEGGKISKLRVFVTRVYPTMYVEKFADGSTVTRSERLEHLHQMKCETERQIQMEKLYEEVIKITEQECDDSEEQYTEPVNLETGSQISRLMKKSEDPLQFKESLTSSQAHMLKVHMDRQNEKFIQKIQNKAQVLIKKRGLDVSRNVVPLMKVRVYDERKAMITIWRPNESLLDFIKEGAWIDVYNVVPTSIRYSEIQISAGRQSIFCKAKFKESERQRSLTQTLRRKCYTIKEIQSSMTTDYNEIDTVGLVFLIEPKDYDGTKELFQNVYLGVDKSIMSVNFWGGVKKFGFENILEVGQLVACLNLQKRAGNTRYIPQYRATEYTYFTKTPKYDSSKKLLDELSTKFVKMDKNKFIQDCIDLKNNYLNYKYSNIENISPYRMNNSEYNISKNKMFIESPLINKDIHSNIESNFKQLSPNTLLRKKKVNEKIAKLKIYGEPPPLTHIHIINKSSEAKGPFKSPLISNDTSSNVANTNFKNGNNVTSTLPVHKISSPVLNRTFVKINPVKLNFGLEENNFAEELDSPPLSLDLSRISLDNL